MHKLTEGERGDVIMDWDEFPEDMVKVIYYDKQVNKIMGYVITFFLAVFGG